MLLLQWLKGKYENSTWPGRFYGLSVLITIFGMVVSNFWGVMVFNLLMLVSSMCFVVGFIIWCFHIFRFLAKVWDKPFGKTPVIILNLLVLLISTVLSRWAVAEALGLPPQSFDVTVGLLALVFYIPAWILLIALIVSFVGFSFLIVASVVSIFMVPFVWGIALLKMVGLLTIFQQLWSKVIPGNLSFKYLLGHSVGALLTGLILITVYIGLTTNFQPWIYSSIRLVAVLSDFQTAIAYPGVKPGERVHPLENGFIAAARQLDDHSISIIVRKQCEDFEDKSEHPVAAPIPSMKQLMAPAVEGFEKYLKSVSEYVNLHASGAK